MTDFLTATKARFIKLGKAGAWSDLCLKDGTLRLDYRHVPESLARAGDFEGLKSDFEAKGIKAGAASNHTRQVIDFFDEDPTVLWITFYRGYLHWCFAQPEVEWINTENAGAINESGAWCRRSRDGWHRTSIGGSELLENELSGKLTKTASYQGTICTVEPLAYLLSKINDDPLPEIIEAENARTQVINSIQKIMSLLTWADFEFLVVAVFEGSGWRQISPPGGSKQTTDIDLIMPVTGEPAFVQIKSSTDQAQFETYLREFKARHETHLFYAYHTSIGTIECNEPNVTLLGAEALAKQVLDAGLFSWLLSKAG